MRILITGCRGFIGGSFGRTAALAGHEVLGMDRSQQKESDWPGGYFQADVADADLSGIISKFRPGVIFHAAGTSSVGESFKDPHKDFRTSVLTWANILDSTRRSGLKPLMLYPSSAAVYGDVSVLPISETAPIKPISPYGFHKAACELLAREYVENFGFQIVVCRLFSLFGSRQKHLLVWELFRQFSGENPTVSLYGTGRESRDFLSIDDVLTAVFQLIEKSFDEPESAYTVVNLAGGQEVEIATMALLLKAMLAPDKAIEYRGLSSPGDPNKWCADTSLIHSIIPDWAPEILENSLSRCISIWNDE
ncbi:MAG: NAD-dependent epimerase/dehydratase family protein [Pyrinomonadaceae bacterium]